LPLLEEDEEFLKSKRLKWELLVDGQAGHCFVFQDFPVDGARYDRSSVTLMVCIPSGYNDAKLDNFYVDPHLRLKSGEYPDRAAHMEEHAGKTWQRFSRHFHDRWRAGVDTLRSI
jgi:hypothetical protein